MTRYGSQKKIFDMVLEILTERGLILKKGTIVDSTFIEAPSSTKNKEKKRDPEAQSTKKGNTWHFGYKAHIVVDSGLVHHVETTPALQRPARRVRPAGREGRGLKHTKKTWRRRSVKKHLFLEVLIMRRWYVVGSGETGDKLPC